MGNKQRTTRRAKKRSHKIKQNHMMEVINKRKRYDTSINESVPSSSNIDEQEPDISDIGTVEKCLANDSNEPSSNLQVDNAIDTEEFVFATSFPELKDIYVGRRIISVTRFFEELKLISNHGVLNCGLNSLTLIGEKKSGLFSKFTFKCKLCNMKFVIGSDTCDENFLHVNCCAVAGIMTIGGGHSHLQEISAAINLPLISNEHYQDIHATLSKHWQEVALNTMEEAAEKERNFALSEGRVNKNGIPIIDVCADGCYSKRSYKTNYSSLSGAGAIIGKRTGEILYLGVKNKYCFTCDRAEKKKIIAQNHKCFKNYSGPSTGMESEIIVEGFKQSLKHHNIIYGRLISDGDSSTYNKILQSRPYHEEGVTVEKIECRNHLLRNFCNKLKKLQTDTRYPVSQRKILTQASIMSTRSVIKKAIQKNKNDEYPDVHLLFDDILLSHLHGFGDHTKCKSYFCDKESEQQNKDRTFFSSSLWQRICLLVQNIAGHSRSLIHDVDSNIVERYHSIVAKYVGGKRINFSLKDSYATRCHAAATSFNKNKSLSLLYKNIVKKSPRGSLKILERKRISKKVINNNYSKKKRRLVFKKNDKSYGEQCVKPDMPDDILSKMKDNFINSLQKTDEERENIQKKTILQKDSSEWMELRRSMLTASNFGRVIKKKVTTPCANLVKNIIYKTNIEHVSSIKHGLDNEKSAILQLEKQESIKIYPCGLYIDSDLPYLGATPDGICGKDTIIEIKCPLTAHKLGLDEAIDKKKVDFWKKDKQNILKVNKNHNWFYQVQGQLHITKRQKCIFAVWSGHTIDLKIEIIEKDDVFWELKMKPKLISFYMDCMLPEIVDPRISRNLPIREPNETKIDDENDSLSITQRHHD